MNELAETVYVVDDDKSVRKSLGALLQAHGFSALTFGAAEEFLASFEPEMAGCLIVDVRMPGMSGLDLQRRLKDDFALLPVIVITGHGDVSVAVEAMKAGAIDFLEKPCQAPALLDAVRRAIAAKRPFDRASVPRSVVAQRLERLTPREREILNHLVLGEINKVIAHNLNISQRTVEIHRARIKEKMEAQSLSDLIRMML